MFTDRQQLLAVACLTGGGLALELALTRLLATRFYPPYVFAVLSLAVLGIGLGAGLAARWPAVVSSERIPPMMMMAALSGALVIALILRAKEFTDLWLFSSLALPYAASGMALATIFRERAAQSPRWYMADLCGAGLGVALVVPAMQWLGVVNGALLAVCSQALAAWFWGRRLWAALAAAALGLLFLANLDRGI